jgi:hypothetical protein
LLSKQDRDGFSAKLLLYHCLVSTLFYTEWGAHGSLNCSFSSLKSDRWWSHQLRPKSVILKMDDKFNLDIGLIRHLASWSSFVTASQRPSIIALQRNVKNRCGNL